MRQIDFVVLSTISQLNAKRQEANNVTIRSHVANVMEKDVSFTAISISLSELKREGYIEEIKDPSRLQWRVTDAGRVMLRKETTSITAMALA